MKIFTKAIINVSSVIIDLTSSSFRVKLAKFRSVPFTDLGFVSEFLNEFKHIARHEIITECQYLFQIGVCSGIQRNVHSIV